MGGARPCIRPGPLELVAGASLTADAVEAELKLAGYRRVRSAFRPASFERDGGRMRLVTREFRFLDGAAPSRRVTVSVSGGRIAAVEVDGEPRSRVRVDPAEIARIFPAHREDRMLLRLADVPPAFLAILLEIEDRRFHEHVGIDPLAIARAAWTNLRAGRTVQGGSTLTQQLAKNFFLSSERTLARKLNEALIALLLEWRYSKRELLEAYLNEVFLGQQGAHAIHGFGRAAHYYFGRALADLDLDEMALLAGMVRGPSYYDPRRHPERAKRRRNQVVDRLEARGVAGARAAERARNEPLGVTRRPPPASARFPAFVDLVRRQLRRDYPGRVLRSEGLRVFTTLDPTVQHESEAALHRSVPLLVRRSRMSSGELQAAVAVTDARSGEVLSIVGGRDPRRGGFNRALDAVRPVGSVIKPAVYLTALSEPGFHLASFVRDDPVRVDGPRGGRGGRATTTAAPTAWCSCTTRSYARTTSPPSGSASRSDWPGSGRRSGPSGCRVRWLPIRRCSSARSSSPPSRSPRCISRSRPAACGSRCGRSAASPIGTAGRSAATPRARPGSRTAAWCSSSPMRCAGC